MEGDGKSRPRTGMIKRVRMHQFMTYRDVEFQPGPRLNLVVGPNGSGKSSIVCAIAIGLGASPRILGRADSIADFVMNTCNDAFTEIELYRDDNGERTYVKRTLLPVLPPPPPPLL